MNRSKPRFRFAVLTAAVASLAFAGVASAAQFNSATGEIRLQGSLTVDAQNGSPVTCPELEWQGPVDGDTWGVTDGSTFWWTPSVYASCSNNTHLRMILNEWHDYVDHYDDQYWLVSTFEPANPILESPWGNYLQQYLEVPFTNAAGGNPSEVTFSNTRIGEGSLGEITATGTLTVDDGNGGNVTITN